MIGISILWEKKRMRSQRKKVDPKYPWTEESGLSK